MVTAGGTIGTVLIPEGRPVVAERADGGCSEGLKDIGDRPEIFNSVEFMDIGDRPVDMEERADGGCSEGVRDRDDRREEADRAEDCPSVLTDRGARPLIMVRSSTNSADSEEAVGVCSMLLIGN